MNSKLKELGARLKKANLDAFLVTKDINIAYLTDFPASESWLLILPQKAFYITDFRYILEAQKGLKGIAVKRYTKSFYQTVVELAAAQKVKRIGFDERHLSLLSFKRLKTECGSRLKPVPLNNFVENLREIKSNKEINLIRQALKLNIKAYGFLKNVIRPGVSEKKILEELEGFVKGHHAGFSFSPIIASGPNSCFPHAKVTGRKVRNNEIVLVDMGMDVKGYKSDLTRIFFLGKIPRQIKQVHQLVAEAQRKAVEIIRPGILAGQVDKEARNHLAKHRLDKFFGHSLGHGVGLEIHEGPTISSNSPAVLREGMVFTVEPAVYIPRRFGIRLEDMVLVTKNGREVLSGALD